MVFISATTITSSTAETVVGIIIDSELNFENHLNSLCNKVSRKINSLDCIINNCMPLGKQKIFDEYSSNLTLMSSNMVV